MTVNPGDSREVVARAIYMTHWGPARADLNNTPLWDNASEAVREWARAQAQSAIDAYVSWAGL